MPIRDFVNKSGFKVLSLLKLNETQYSLILYLMNTAVSGLDQIVTNAGELAEHIDYPDTEIADAIYALSDMNIIKVRYSDKTTTAQQNPSMSISINFNTKSWLTKNNEEAYKSAVVYPFTKGALINVVEPKKKLTKSPPGLNDETWQRVINHFAQERSLDDVEIESTENAAKMLVEHHPVDQVLLLIKHFGKRIPTLSLLMSSWSHYQETYMAEHHNIDLLGARKKHVELDEQFVKSINDILGSDTSDFSEEEIHILEIIKKHKHPRRQLFWAYQARSKYPKLSDFFEANCSVMLPVTTSGNILKK